MVTRERQVGHFLIKESRPLSHWLVFDFMGFMLKVVNNNWIYLPNAFEWILTKYVSFTHYSRDKSEMIVQKTTIEDNIDYSQDIKDALHQLDELPEFTNPETLN